MQIQKSVYSTDVKSSFIVVKYMPYFCPLLDTISPVLKECIILYINSFMHAFLSTLTET